MWRRKYAKLAIVGAVLFGVAGCGKSEQKPQASAAAPASAAVQPPPAPARVFYPVEEGVVLSHLVRQPQLVMQLNVDGNDGAGKLSSIQSGADQETTYMSTTFDGCGQGTHTLNLSQNLNNDDVDRWLLGHNLLVNQSYTINVLTGGGLTPTQFTCPVLQDSIRQYLPADQQNADIHHGMQLPLAGRLLLKYTFENEYESAEPGMGTVKVFAGTFKYAVMSRLPGVVVSGQGTGSVKMHLSPDNGQWTIDEFQLQDPTIGFQ